MNQDAPIDSADWRRFYRYWLVVALLFGAVNASSVYMEHVRDGAALPAWLPIVNEFSGSLALWALLPLIRWVDERFPLRPESNRVSIPAHLAATLPFAAIHTALFVAVRTIVYPLFGSRYDFGELSFELLYEYRKIAVGYALALASIYGFRHYLQLRRLLDMPDASSEGDSAAEAPPQRFLARRANREVIVDVDDVHYLEAAGNYVVLHTSDGELKLRDTLTRLAARLEASDFVRVHRSYVVNLDAVREIQPWHHGDQRLLLRDGSFLNLSRRYRDAVRERFDSAPAASV